MRLNPQDLEKIADLTLEYYNRHAEDFREGTRDCEDQLAEVHARRIRVAQRCSRWMTWMRHRFRAREG